MDIGFRNNNRISLKETFVHRSLYWHICRHVYFMLYLSNRENMSISDEKKMKLKKRFH